MVEEGNCTQRQAVHEIGHCLIHFSDKRRILEVQCSPEGGITKSDGAITWEQLVVVAVSGHVAETLILGNNPDFEQDASYTIDRRTRETAFLEIWKALACVGAPNDPWRLEIERKAREDASAIIIRNKAVLNKLIQALQVYGRLPERYLHLVLNRDFVPELEGSSP